MKQVDEYKSPGKNKDASTINYSAYYKLDENEVEIIDLSKQVERKRIGLENHLARICQDIRDNVTANYACPPINHALGDATSPSSNDSDSNDG